MKRSTIAIVWLLSGLARAGTAPEAWSFQPGEVRAYRLTSGVDHPDLAMAYLGASQARGAKRHTFRFLQGKLADDGFNAAAWVDLMVDDAGNAVSMEVVTPGEEHPGTSALVSFEPRSIRYRTAEKLASLEIPEAFREDYEKHNFCVFSATIPLLATFPIARLAKQGGDQIRLSAFYAGVEGYWISRADPNVKSFEAYEVMRHEAKKLQVNGKSVDVHAYEVSPEKRLRSEVSTTSALRRPLFIAASDDGIIYGMEYGTDASWRLDRVLALKDVREATMPEAKKKGTDR